MAAPGGTMCPQPPLTSSAACQGNGGGDVTPECSLSRESSGMTTQPTVEVAQTVPEISPGFSPNLLFGCESEK